MLYILLSLGLLFNPMNNSYLNNYSASYLEVQSLEKEYIFVGDSRFVGMSECQSKNDKFICEISQGYDYFRNQQDNIKELDNYNKNIVIGFGINDLHNIDKYIEFVNKNIYKGTVYFLTVNPVDENLYYKITNKEIDDFNYKLKKNAKNYKVIDTNNYLGKYGFKTSDGVHYDYETYQLIYDYIKEMS